MSTTKTVTPETYTGALRALTQTGVPEVIAEKMVADAFDNPGAEQVAPPFVHRVTWADGYRPAGGGYVSARYTVELPASIHAMWAVGDGATVHWYVDAHAFTVIKVTASTVTIQRDRAIPDPNWVRDFTPGGFWGHTSNDRDLTYTYEPDPDGEVRTVRLTKRGWSSKGQRVSKGRHEFYDSNF